MSDRKTALVAGATGLVGSHLVKRLLDADEFEQVIVMTRRPLGFDHPKLVEMIGDFERMDEVTLPEKVSDAFCCLGTTIEKAGSQEAFRKVDYDYVLGFARLARRCGAGRFLMVSAIGSTPRTTIFYSRVKGEAERDVRLIGFPALDIFQPGLLLGPRKERRTGEDIAKAFAPVMNIFFVGPIKRYRAIEADMVAAAMVEAAVSGVLGDRVHTYADMERLAAA